MTLQELRYLVALADTGFVVRAAEACHVGQPTLSMQLRKLEDYLGVILFERSRHHLVPTPVGERIIARARHLGAYVQADLKTEAERRHAERHRKPEAVLAETAVMDF